MIYFPLTILQLLSQLGRSTNTDPTKHFSDENSLLKIISSYLFLFPSLNNSSSSSDNISSYWLVLCCGCGVSVISQMVDGDIASEAVTASVVEERWRAATASPPPRTSGVLDNNNNNNNITNMAMKNL